MATTSGYDYGIRQGLVNKGVSSSDIGYNPANGYVTVKGQNAIKAPKMYNGTSFTNQQSFNADWDAYNKSQQQSNTGGMIAGYGQKPNPQGTGYTSPSTGYKPPTTQQVQPNQQYNPYQQTTSQNPYTSQADAVIKQLLNYGQNQANFDPYSSSGYRAAEAQAQRAAQGSTRAAQEAYGSAGMGRSFGLGERVSGIQNDATEYLMTQVVPQLEAQEQARRQQEYNNMLNALSPLMNQQGRADQLVQQDFSNAITQGQLTGRYMPAGAQDVIGQLMALKQQAEAQGITRDARTGLSQQADVLRSQLQAMGVDPALFGSNVSQSQAAQNVNRAGQMTMDKQAQDFAQRANIRDYKRDVVEADRNFGEGVRQYDTNLEYTQGRDTVKDAQWQAEFDRIAGQDGIQNAIAWANQSLNREQFEDASARDWAGLDYDMANAGAEAKSTFTPNQVYSAIEQKYKDFFDGTTKAAPADYESMYRDVINYGLPEDQENDILRGIGISDSQIAAFDKKYLSGN